MIGWFGLRRETKLHGAGFWIRPMLLEIVAGAVFAGLYWWEVGQCGLIADHVVNQQFAVPLLTPVGISQPRQIAFAMLRHEQFFAHIVLFCFMLMAFWIDIDEMTIPDGVTLPCTLLGLIIMAAWPYALLPESNNFPTAFGLPLATSVWLTSPHEVPPPLGNPQFLQPWQIPAVMGWPALVAAIAGFWAWCLALAPGRWSTRHGFVRAVRVFTARMVRERATYGLLGLAILGSAAIAWVWSIGGSHWAGLASSLAGIVIGGGLVWIVRVFAYRVLHREAMGFGDVTLLAMIGAFLGWQATIIVFFLAPLAAVFIGIGRLLLRGEKEIPFGPFLCLAAGATILAWPAIWDFMGERYFAQGWVLIVILLGCLCLLVVLLPPVRWLVGRMKVGTK